eukprot:g2807.t1
MKMARLLRKFSEEHWEPEVHEVVVETNIRSEDVERLKGLRESLVARRRASEIQGQLPAREAELEVNRARELVDARKTRELRQQQEAEELRALEREAEAIQEKPGLVKSTPLDGPRLHTTLQEASEKAAELGTVRTDGVQERLKVELQRLQAENQELLRAAQQVRSEDRGSKKEVSVLQAEVNKLKATLAAYRDGTCEMESQLESASKTKAAKMQKLRDLKAKKAELEEMLWVFGGEEHRTLEAQLKADKKRAQELEAEKVSLQHAVKEAEETTSLLLSPCFTKLRERKARRKSEAEASAPRCAALQQLLQRCYVWRAFLYWTGLGFSQSDSFDTKLVHSAKRSDARGVRSLEETLAHFDLIKPEEDPKDLKGVMELLLEEGYEEPGAIRRYLPSTLWTLAAAFRDAPPLAFSSCRHGRRMRSGRSKRPKEARHGKRAKTDVMSGSDEEGDVTPRHRPTEASSPERTPGRSPEGHVSQLLHEAEERSQRRAAAIRDVLQSIRIAPTPRLPGRPDVQEEAWAANTASDARALAAIY